MDHDHAVPSLSADVRHTGSCTWSLGVIGTSAAGVPLRREVEDNGLYTKCSGLKWKRSGTDMMWNHIRIQTYSKRILLNTFTARVLYLNIRKKHMIYRQSPDPMNPRRAFPKPRLSRQAWVHGGGTIYIYIHITWFWTQGACSNIEQSKDAHRNFRYAAKFYRGLL